MTTREVGLAPLSLVDLSPPELVAVAARAGFDFVGVRVRQVPGAEVGPDVLAGSDVQRETVVRCRDSGTRVEDVEFVLLDGRTGPAQWRPALDAGAALGARSLTVAVNDPDESRCRDALSELVLDARTAGLMVTLEPISYNNVCSVPHARRLAKETGCRVLLDGLHLLRMGSTREEVAEAAPHVSLFQLCDAPARRPATREGLVAESRGERLAPGLGSGDLAGFLTELPSDLPVSVEVPSVRERAARDPEEYAAYLHRATVAFLESSGATT
jgi:sugar phosphate isomerase/epimerase